MTLEEAIEEYRQVVEDKILDAEAAKKKFDHLVELQKIKVKRLNGERLTEEDVQKSLNLLCYNDFAGCCAPWKDCPWHRSVCDALGVDPKELYDIKKNAIGKMIRRLLAS